MNEKFTFVAVRLVSIYIIIGLLLLSFILTIPFIVFKAKVAKISTQSLTLSGNYIYHAKSFYERRRVEVPKYKENFTIWQNLFKQYRHHHDLRLPYSLQDYVNVTWNMQKVDNYRKSRSSLEYPILPSFIKSKKLSQKCLNPITLYTFISYSSIEDIFPLIKAWDGPISLALYIENYKEFGTNMDERLPILHQKMESLSNVQIDIHLLFGRKFLLGIQKENQNLHHPYDFLFPINALKNLALLQVKTNFVLSIEPYSIPSQYLYQFLCHDRHFDSILKTKTTDWHPALFVLPEWEYVGSESYQYKTTKHKIKGPSMEVRNRAINRTTLHEHCIKGTIIPRGSKLGKRGPPSRDDLQNFCTGGIELSLKNKQTSNLPIQFSKNTFLIDYSHWLNTTIPYSIPKSTLMMSIQDFTPIFISKSSQQPLYNEILRGGPFSRQATIAQWIMESDAQVIVLSDHFVVDSGAKKTFLNGPELDYAINSNILEKSIKYIINELKSKTSNKLYKFKQRQRSQSWLESLI